MILNTGQISRRMRRGRALGVLGLAALPLIAACASGDSGARTPGSTGTSLQVVVGFYPLEFVAARLGGDLVTVRNLTPPGGEPHDLEVSASDLVALRTADLVIHLGGFMPSLDEGVVTAASGTAFDVRAAARLVTNPSGRGRSGSTLDPHFWLDPLRLADVGDAIAELFARVDATHARMYLANAAQLRQDLEQLDGEFTAGLRSCSIHSMVTSHEAFGYLAARYGLTLVSVSGLSPEAEPTATALAAVADIVRNESITTIYTETLASSEVAETLASETGATTALLDPLEGLVDRSGDYFSVMRTNLATLRIGQVCT